MESISKPTQKIQTWDIKQYAFRSAALSKDNVLSVHSFNAQCFVFAETTKNKGKHDLFH